MYMNNIFYCFRQQAKTEKETRARELAYIYYRKKSKKKDGLVSGVRERRWREKSAGKKRKNRRMWGTTKGIVSRRKSK